MPLEPPETRKAILESAVLLSPRRVATRALDAKREGLCMQFQAEADGNAIRQKQ